ncbi:MAG: LD-carboxypeptidase [Bacteroidota bacterium]
MQRRNFLRNIALASASVPLMSFDSFDSAEEENELKITKPKALKKGDTIGLITPGSYISDEGLETAIDNVKSLGFKVKLSKNIRKERGYTAGSKEERVDDLHEMFADPEIKGIWAARGGYGCSGLLPLIDFDLIRKNPKVFIGYSDITVLHLAIFKKTGLVTFHGPVASSTFTDYTRKYVEKMITSTEIPPKVYPCKENDTEALENEFFKPKVFKSGKAKGRLVGGNLSLIAALVGTEWEMELSDKLIFIEDIGEAPYRIDRMLIQVDQNKDLNDAKGLIFGVFDDAEKPEDELSLSLEQMFDDNTKDLEIPCAYGFSFGHIDNQFTLPLGIMARMNSDKRTIEFLESAVV